MLALCSVGTEGGFQRNPKGSCFAHRVLESRRNGFQQNAFERRFSAKILTEFFVAKKTRPTRLFATSRSPKRRGSPKTRGTQKCYPFFFRKRANHKSRNAQRQSESEPQNEGRFADCAISVIDASLEMQVEVSIIWKKTQPALSG